MKNLQDVGIDNDFFWKNPVEKCSASTEESDVMTSFGHSAYSGKGA
jgi:hypothetical protein